MMAECWNVKPLERPTFTKLAERLGYMLEDSVRKVSDKTCFIKLYLMRLII